MGEILTIKNRGITGQIKEYFVGNTGRTITLSELTSNLKNDARVIQQSMASILREKTPGFAVVVRAKAWKYDPATRPETKSDKRMFEEIGKTREGEIVIQDDNGVLYLARNL
jgi:hypothetical protein